MKFEYACMTHKGRKRAHNEDQLLVVESEGLFCVADGMGGHLAGETASRMAVETVTEYMRANSRALATDAETNRSMIAEAIRNASESIFGLAQANEEYAGMGTTIVALLLRDNKAVLANVGDSRIYRMRGGKLKQITEDHSLLNDYRKRKGSEHFDEDNFPFKNVITRALGVEPKISVDTFVEDIELGDIYMMCSDGLTGMVSDDRIEKMLESVSEDIEKTCRGLIRAANAGGGDDNITVVLVRIIE